MSGIVLSIHIAKHARAPMQSVETAQLVSGKGIVGDRYFLGVGTFSPPPRKAIVDMRPIRGARIESAKLAGDLERDDWSWLAGLSTFAGSATRCRTATSPTP